MRRTWPSFVAVALVGALAGAAIAGRPTQTDNFVVDPSSVAATSSTSTTTAAPATTTTTTTAPPTAPTTTTTAPTTTTPVTTPVTDDTGLPGTIGVRDRAGVRVVLANGDGRFDLVGRNVDRLLELGYVTIDQTDVSDRPAVTTIYVRPGFDDEAAVLAADLQTPNASIVPVPDTPVTGSDDLGDLIVVLGPDALR